MRQWLQPLFTGASSTATTPTPQTVPGYSPIPHILAGAVAGGLAAYLTTPLDVVKTLLQTRGVSSCTEIRAVDSMPKAVRLLFKREGLAAFWRGSRARVLAHMPATALSWGVYEYFKWTLSPTISEGKDDSYSPVTSGDDLVKTTSNVSSSSTSSSPNREMVFVASSR